ncbi:MAG: hypothetical protein ACM369_04480 [Acidobacteriota bacterium]
MRETQDGQLTAVGDPVSDLEKQVADLARALRSVEARVAALEGEAAPAEPLPSPEPATSQAGAPSLAAEAGIPSVIALTGRCLFVLAGAFLVRALTDSGTFPRGAGVALGLAYALTWLVLSDRAGRAGSLAAATAWGVTALVIACPLVWEACTRFDVLGPTAAAALLFAVAAAALGASVHRNLGTLAWAAVLSVLATAGLLLATTHALIAFGALLVLLTAGAAEASVRRGWAGLPWLPAIVVDLVVLEAVWIAARPEGLPEAYADLSRGAVLALALAVFGVALVGTIRGAFGRPETPGVFESVQLGAALLLAVFALSRLTPLAGFPPSLVWGVAGFAAAVAPARAVGSMAPAYGAVLLLTGALVSGLAGFVRHAFLGPSVTRMPGADPLVVLALSAVATALLVRRVRAGGGSAARGATFALACVSIAGAGALAVLGLTLVVAPDGEPGRTAAVRGSVLAAASVLLAWLRGFPTLAPLARLTYPVLAIAGLKLLVDDLPHGRPSTLVATFVMYGAALIIVPRILRAARAA